MAPEIKVVFPVVQRIGISRTVFSDIADSGKVDTVNVALVQLKKPISAAERTKLASYIEARMNIKNVEIVSIP